MCMIVLNVVMAWGVCILGEAVGEGGGLVFLEVVRRCTFGAGLLWMCTLPKVTHSLCEGSST